MSLSSLYLDAFIGIARAQSFSGAAKTLNISQSALSQRIRNLEEDLGLSLFIRTSGGIQLTEQGQKLLRYCQTKDSLEEELLSDIKAQGQKGLSGHVRLGTYSSVYRSVIVPALGEFLSAHPDVSCEFHCTQVDELPALLQRSEVDFIVTDTKIDRSHLECETLGREQLVLIESRQKSQRGHYFLDNDRNDPVTEEFFRNKKLKYNRSYFADCYGIIDAVERGLGRAIMPLHLIKENKKLRVSKGHKAKNINVYLQYHSQPFYSELHKLVINELIARAQIFLK